MIILKSIYVSFYESRKEYILTCQEFLDKKIDTFYLVLNDQFFPEKNQNLIKCFYQETNSYDPGFNNFINFFKALGYEQIICFENGKFYTKLAKNRIDLSLNSNYYEYRFVETENIDFILIEFYEYNGLDVDAYDHTPLLNYNHPIISKIFSILKNEGSDMKAKYLAQEITQYVAASKYHESGFEIRKLNLLMSELQKHTDIRGKFSKKDFSTPIS